MEGKNPTKTKRPPKTKGVPTLRTDSSKWLADYTWKLTYARMFVANVIHQLKNNHLVLYFNNTKHFKIWCHRKVQLIQTWAWSFTWMCQMAPCYQLTMFAKSFTILLPWLSLLNQALFNDRSIYLAYLMPSHIKTYTAFVRKLIYIL